MQIDKQKKKTYRDEKQTVYYWELKKRNIEDVLVLKRQAIQKCFHNFNIIHTIMKSRYGQTVCKRR